MLGQASSSGQRTRSSARAPSGGIARLSLRRWALPQGPHGVRRLRGTDPLGMRAEPAEQQPPSARRRAQPVGVGEQAPGDRAGDRKDRGDPPLPVTAPRPVSTRRQRDHRARAPALGELQREQAAQRVARDVRGLPAGRVELALEAVGQRPDPRGDAVGKALAVQVAQERGSEHFEGALQLVE